MPKKNTKTNELDYSRARVFRIVHKMQQKVKLLRSDLGNSRKLYRFPGEVKTQNWTDFLSAICSHYFVHFENNKLRVGLLKSAKCYRTILNLFHRDDELLLRSQQKKFKVYVWTLHKLLELESRYFCFTLISNWIKAIYMRVICYNYLWRKW